MRHPREVTEPLHPTAIEYLKAERRLKTSVAKEAADRAALKAAKVARDQAIRDDPNPVHEQVAKHFGVSSTWVKKVRGTTK